jgi:hypothetical protein
VQWAYIKGGGQLGKYSRMHWKSENGKLTENREKGKFVNMIKDIIWKWNIPKAAKLLRYKTYYLLTVK